MERWHLETVDAAGRREPRVLFSEPECRGVLIDLHAGEELGSHSVRERALLEVVTGRVAIAVEDEEADAGPGTLVVFAPGERHAVRATEASRLLMLLAPWPAEGHYAPEEGRDPQRVGAGAHRPGLRAP
jgi:quercetin dioxygenase-like cupin family protein